MTTGSGKGVAMGDASGRGPMLVRLLTSVERATAAAERSFPSVDHLTRPPTRPDDAELAALLADARAGSAPALAERFEAWIEAERALRGAVDRLAEVHAHEGEAGAPGDEELDRRIHAVRDGRARLERAAEELRRGVAAEIDAPDRP